MTVAMTVDVYDDSGRLKEVLMNGIVKSHYDYDENSNILSWDGDVSRAKMARGNKAKKKAGKARKSARKK